MNKVVSFCGGRFGNQLYYLLQAYKNCDRYHPCASKDILECFKLLEMDDIIDFKNTDIVRINSYCQSIGRDFTIDDVDRFINDKILKSKYFNGVIGRFGYNDKDMLLYIRCGDYIGLKTHDIFDRFDYIERALQKIENRDIKLVVQSDDIEYCRKNYSSIIEKYFKNIEWRRPDKLLDDFIHLCSFKNKIIWNSTFSIWSAFISNVIFKNSYQNIICPNAVHKWHDFSKISSVYNDKWNIIFVRKI